MKRAATLGVIVSLLAAGSAAPAADQKATADVDISTTQLKMTLPPGMSFPGFGQPQRSLTVVVLSPGAAPADATATLNVPDGLGLGKTLTLGITRPTPPADGGNAGGGGNGGGMANASIRMYWGCGAAVGDNQPKAIQMDESMRSLLQRMAPRMRWGLEETMANWPSGQSQQGSLIGNNASAVGKYSLNTSYTGNNSFEVGADQDFLAPLQLNAPTGPPDLAQSIDVSWNKVPNALGYLLIAYGTKQGDDGKQTITIWTSSHNGSFAGGANGADVVAGVGDGTYLSPETTTCTIPAGILNGSRFAMLMVQALGPTRVVDGTPSIRVRSISSVTMPLLAFNPGAFGGGGGFGGGRGRPRQ